MGQGICAPSSDTTVSPDVEPAQQKGRANIDEGVDDNKAAGEQSQEASTKRGDDSGQATASDDKYSNSNNRNKSNSNKRGRREKKSKKNKRKNQVQKETQKQSDQSGGNAGPKAKNGNDLLRTALQEQITQCDEEIAQLKQQIQERRSELEESKENLNQQEDEREDKKAELRDEQQRVARLKLQTQLREKELMVAQQQAEEGSGCTRTYMEGRLFKFGKQGKLYPKEKAVQVHLLSTGSVVLDYCDNIRSNKVDRHVIDKIQSGEKFLSGNTEFYKGRVFAVNCTNNGKAKNKTMVFACDGDDDCKQWTSRITKALEDRPENVETPPESVVFEITFDKRPLGFSVDLDMSGKHLVVTSIQTKTLDLVEGVKVISANGQDFTGKPRTFMLDYLKWEACPLTIRFEAGEKELKELDIEASVEPSARHRAKPSMQDLYPKAASNDLANHPLVKNNEEFRTWMQNPSFRLLLEELTKYPDKLDEYLSKDL